MKRTPNEWFDYTQISVLRWTSVSWFVVCIKESLLQLLVIRSVNGFTKHHILCGGGELLACAAVVIQFLVVAIW